MAASSLARLVFVLFAALLYGAEAHPTPRTVHRRNSNPDLHWVDTWTAMPQLTEFTNLPGPPFVGPPLVVYFPNQSELVFYNTTIRQSLHMSIGASKIRLRISNAFGLNDLPITKVTIAQPEGGDLVAGSPQVQPHSIHDLTFSGNQSFVIPNGGLVVSDPLNFAIRPLQMITVTMYLAEGQASNFITSHPGSRTTSWYSFGDYTRAANMTDPSTQSAAHWFFLSAVEAFVPPADSAFVIVGDSITDGRGSDNNANNRWPDLVLAKMQKNSSTANIAVVNQAAGGNRVLYDGLGPNALGRIDRDVLAQSGVKYAMIFEGVNDIGTADATVANQTFTGDRLIQAYKQIVERVHTFGIPIFAATITPFGAPNNTIQAYSDPLREQTRQKVNSFIRHSGTFDDVIDFDAIVRDPKNHTQLNPLYNSGDYLHPNVAGYEAIAAAFPLDIFFEPPHIGQSGTK
ncbi:SGNH hydrolase-type esterase domain-containing protein [Xylogone sp. PMI_703]|nr:SGNH hydrolase-type esterase domain-containing protein [Xylogone sp. PMI_703]